MPIFSRRRIQQMLDDLIGVVAPAQFIGRLNDKRFENALPAEAELALVWAASRLGGFESEPKWYSPEGRLPEGISTALLVPGQPDDLEHGGPQDDRYLLSARLS